MTISLKDCVKLTGIVIVCFCAVFVCTFFLSFYLDVLPLRDSVTAETLPLYDAQIATAQMCCAVTGGVLTLISVIMLIFYVKLYVDTHAKELGTLKALGYSNRRLAMDFVIFGVSVFIGCALGFGSGYASAPFIYEQLTIEGMSVNVNFHVELLFALVIAPTVVFSALAALITSVALRRPALDIIRGIKKIKISKTKSHNNKKRTFVVEMALKTVSANKPLTFFVAFSCFCFSAMVQMGASMENLVSGTMGWMILVIGLVLALTSAFIALTSLLKNNAKTIALMKTMGYALYERTTAVFIGFIPFALLGFALGTAYQYGLLSLMINLIFKNVNEVPDYTFNVNVMFITLAAFIAVYTAISAIYVAKLNKVSVKEIMLEN